MKQQAMSVPQRAIEICDNMRAAHSDFRSGALKRDDADTIANINGKNLKGLAIITADRMCDLAFLAMDTKMKLIDAAPIVPAVESGKKKA